MSDSRFRPRHPLRAWQSPLVTMAGMAVAVALVHAAGATRESLVLAAVLALSLARSRLLATWRGRAEALLLLPLVGLLTDGVGLLLLREPLLGAAAYALAMFLSVWLRRYGELGRRGGALIALPFVTLLVAPGAAASPLEAAAIALCAFGVTALLGLLAQAAGLLPRVAADADAPAPAPPVAATMTPSASTRMAIQLALAVLAAFALGYALFPAHVGWVVLTAFVICSGNRGRADVLHKSGLRLAGAIAGALLAAGLAALVPDAGALAPGPGLVVLLLAIVGLGLWLRQWTYAAWALAMTLAVALLQQALGPGVSAPVGAQVWERVLAIVAGAACALLPSWFVLPVRSEPMLRRRLADLLAALGEYLADPSIPRERALEQALRRLDEIAPPWQAAGRVLRGGRAARPARWLRLAHECAALAHARPHAGGEARRALGAARRAMREPETIGAALQALRDTLAADAAAPLRTSS